jgi:hypothetical protein
MQELLRWVQAAGAAGSVSIGVYVLLHANDPTSLIGGWRYRRDLREYFYLAVEGGMEPSDALEWATGQLAEQWGGPTRPNTRVVLPR